MLGVLSWLQVFGYSATNYLGLEAGDSIRLGDLRLRFLRSLHIPGTVQVFVETDDGTRVLYSSDFKKPGEGTLGTLRNYVELGTLTSLSLLTSSLPSLTFTDSTSSSSCCMLKTPTTGTTLTPRVSATGDIPPWYLLAISKKLVPRS